MYIELKSHVYALELREIVILSLNSFSHLQCQDLRARDARIPSPDRRTRAPKKNGNVDPRRSKAAFFKQQLGFSTVHRTHHPIKVVVCVTVLDATLLPRKEMRCDNILTDQGLPQRPVCWSLTQTSHGVQYSEFIADVR